MAENTEAIANSEMNLEVAHRLEEAINENTVQDLYDNMGSEFWKRAQAADESFDRDYDIELGGDGNLQSITFNNENIFEAPVTEKADPNSARGKVGEYQDLSEVIYSGRGR